MNTTNALLLLSGIALFLFGMTLMGDGLKKASGSKLEPILFRLSSTPFRGILLGTGVTAVLQSSCATSVMAVGFVNSQMMKVRQAIGVILGSILGTSITGWIICLSYIDGGAGIGALLSTRNITAIIAVTGIILRLFCRKPTHQYVGDIFMGFAVLMMGMSTMSDAVSALGEQPWFTAMLTSMTNPALGILVGVLFTAILQSASAAVGILQALSVTGVMTFQSSLPLVMGIAIGASIPVLLSAVGAGTDGKRTAIVYLVASLLGTAVLAAVFYSADALWSFPFMGRTVNPFSLAFVNTVYRLAMLCLLAPFTHGLEALVTRLVPGDKTDRDDPALRLEERFLVHPALAIEQSRIVLNDMADQARGALEKAVALLDSYHDEGYQRVEAMEASVDRYEDAIGSYLVKLTSRELTEDQNRQITRFLHALTDYERISDHAMNIAESAREVYEKKISFSEEGVQEIKVLTGATIEVLRLATDAFAGDDLGKAVRVEPLEEVIDELCEAVKRHHIERLQQGKCTILNGFVLNDLVTDCERVSDHCSNIAIVMLELARGTLGTHTYLEDLKKENSSTFDHFYRDYKTQFALSR